MKYIQNYKYSCKSCGESFEGPSLGDFVYGEFLLWADSGAVKYLNAINDLAYEELDLLIQRFAMAIDIQSIYGKIACDPNENGEYFSIRAPFCPCCNSVNLSLSKSESNNLVPVGEITHDYWDSLSEKEKIFRLLSFVEKN